MSGFPRVVQRGRINSTQITPKGVEALEIAITHGGVWKYLLIGKYWWRPSTADRTIDGLAESGYIARMAEAGSGSRHKYVATELGKQVALRFRNAKPRMKLPSSITNLGGGDLIIRWDDSVLGMTSGAFFSGPVGLDDIRVYSTEGNPVVGMGVKICPRCGKVNETGSPCARCGFYV
jgi:hypothetical protein